MRRYYAWMAGLWLPSITKRSRMKSVGKKALTVLKNPVLRPVEIWALRALFAAVAGYLGLKSGVV